MDDVLFFLGISGALFGGFIFGYYLDITNRVQLMRNLFKKDYIILSIVNSTTNIEDEYIVERQGDTITWKTYTWACKGAKFYLRLGAAMDNKTANKGASLAIRKRIQVLYVSTVDYLPLEMGEPRKDAATADAINSALQAHIYHTIAKRVVKFANDLSKLNTWQIITLLGVIICIYLTYSGNGGTYKMCSDALNATMVVMP
jgi:hypothetical protein